MNHLRLSADETEYRQGNDQALFISGIADFNILVGANNSRKSRLLRSIIRQSTTLLWNNPADLNKLYWEGEALASAHVTTSEQEELLWRFHRVEGDSGELQRIDRFFQRRITIPNVVTISDLVSSIKAFGKALIDIVDEEQLQDALEQICDVRAVIIMILETYRIHSERLSEYESIMKAEHLVLCEIPGIDATKPLSSTEWLLSYLNVLLRHIDLLLQTGVEEKAAYKIYIPALRSPRKLKGTTIDKDVFRETLKVQHFPSPPPILNIETGLDLYAKLNSYRNGETQEREALRQFNAFIGATFFNGPEIEVIPHSKTGEVIVSIPGERKDVPIYDLGEGIQNIIILLFPIFTAPGKAWIFVDEPENHLHPGFQNIFVKAITENEYILSKQHRFFINSHSNHILTETLIGAKSSAIFVLNRQDENTSGIHTIMGKERAALEILGVLNTSVLISNCSVWVEGVTDRMYLRSWLKSYLDAEKPSFQPVEGYHYSFIEYAGKNLTHYTFEEREGAEQGTIEAFFINSKVFLLADSDFSSERLQQYRDIDNDNFEFSETQLPEIENLLPSHILKRFFQDEVQADPDSIDRAFPIDVNKKLGEYFEGKVTKCKKPISIKASTGGTLSSHYKRRLAEFVFTGVQTGEITWADLRESNLVCDLVGKLYAFIASNSDKLRPEFVNHFR